MVIHSIHYRSIIYCNWLCCCDPPSASFTIHLMIVFDSFCSTIGNLSLPPFLMNRPKMHTSAWPKGWRILLSWMARICWLYYCGEGCSVFRFTAYHIAFVSPTTHQTCWAITITITIIPVFMSSQGAPPHRVVEWYKDDNQERGMLSHFPMSDMNHESSKTPVTGVYPYPHLHHHHWTTSPHRRGCRFPLLGPEILNRLLNMCGVWDVGCGWR